MSLVAAATLATTAAAFQINPLKDKYRGNSPRGGLMEKITQSVHEDITDAAVSCASKWRQLPVGAERPPCRAYPAPIRRHDHGNKADPLIRGVWWNDDPNQMLWGVEYPMWLIYMRDARTIATKHRNWWGRRTTINATYKMQYRSHYGDLQFLHAMANADQETAEDVRERMLLWAGFAYKVAIGQISIEARLGDLDDELARRYFKHQPGWTVNYLFGPKYRLNAETMPEVALGSILHMIQDSFSEAHARRTYLPTARCPFGGVVEFHSYIGQDTEAHDRTDTRAALQGNTRLTDRMNPIEASAMLLSFAQTKADWKAVVEPYLVETLFCLDEGTVLASPGPYTKLQRK